MFKVVLLYDRPRRLKVDEHVSKVLEKVRNQYPGVLPRDSSRPDWSFQKNEKFFSRDPRFSKGNWHRNRNY